jgi:hypothetical protein
MPATQDILFGITGQSLVFDAPEGRASSVVSSTVYESFSGDTSTAEGATTGSAAVDTNPATTFDAASGDGQANPRKCNLTATTGIVVGRPYRATSATGEVDIVEVTAIAAADYVIVREPLKNAYTSADTFVTTRIAHAIDSTWVAASDNLSPAFDPNPRYRWRLVYVVSSVTCVHDLYFDLVRYAGRHDVSPVDVDRRAPGWLDRLPDGYEEDQGRALIEEAYQAIKFDLYNFAIPDQSLRNREAVNELVKLKAIAMVDANETTERRYNDRMQQLIAGGKVNVSKSASGAASPGDSLSKWSK